MTNNQKKSKSNDLVIKSLAEFFEEIQKFNDFDEYIYRGQLNCCWEVESSAFRRLKKPEQSTIIGYNEELIKNAKHYKNQLDSDCDIEILAQLQHLKAATSLIDFSKDALIALWFACEDANEDGAVFCFNKTEKTDLLEIANDSIKEPIASILNLRVEDTTSTDELNKSSNNLIKKSIANADKPNAELTKNHNNSIKELTETLNLRANKDKNDYAFGYYEPAQMNNRILKQQSVFLFTPNGGIENSKFIKIIIESEAKEQIKKDLEKLCGLKETTVYPDLQGFADANSSVQPFASNNSNDEIFKDAVDYYQKYQYDQAISSFNSLLIKEDLTQELKARCLNYLAIAYRNLGQIDKAIEYHNQALVISREIKDRKAEGIILGNLGNAYFSLEQIDKAIEYHNQALVISREIKDRKGEGSDLGNLGLAYINLGKNNEAIEYCNQALVIAREIKDRYAEGSHLGNLGIAYRNLEQIDKAIEHYNQALVIAREIKDRNGEANHLGNLGNAYLFLGQFDKAIKYSEQSYAIFTQIKSPNAQRVKKGLEKLKRAKLKKDSKKDNGND